MIYKSKYPVFSDKNIHSTGKLVYWFMVSNGAASPNKAFFYSKRKIAESLNLSLATVERHIKKLESEGYIQIINRYRKNGGKSSNLYQILK